MFAIYSVALVAAIVSLSSQGPISSASHISANARSTNSKPHKFQLYHNHHAALNRRSFIPKNPVASLAVIPGAFSTLVTIGSQTFSFLVDTGSAATWLATTNTSCRDFNSTYLSPLQYGVNCGYDNVISVGNADASWRPLIDPKDNRTAGLKISYGSGQNVIGQLGTGDVSIAGLKVPNITFALTSITAFNGADNSSGLLGLAFSALNNYSGTVPFPSLTDTIFSEGLADPIFTLALSRDASGSGYGGSMMFGGELDLLADLTVNSTVGSANVTIPMLPSPQDGEYEFYLINVGGIIPCDQVPATMYNSSHPHVLDSGTTTNYLDDHSATVANSRFNPPAARVRWPGGGTLWTAACDAHVERFGFRIGGADFYMAAEDMVLQDIRLNGTHCLTANQQRGVGVSVPGILGGQFLKNVVATFDVQTKQISLSAREIYKS